MMFSKVLSVVAAYSSTLAQLYYPFILNFYFFVYFTKEGVWERRERRDRERREG